jgi:hypothetical protein
MAEIYSEYNGDPLTPEQIEFLRASLLADLDAMAEPEQEAG